MSKELFLLLNLAVAFYNVGTIWAHEVDIFRSWQYLDPQAFRTVQSVHWKKIPWWVFLPVGLSFIGSVILFWYHPPQVPLWQISFAFSVQLLSHILTAAFWGQWQAKLSKDPQGGNSPYLRKILKTHWVRTALISIYGLMVLAMCVQLLPHDSH